MWTWIKTQMFGGFEGVSFSKEPVVWLGAIVVVLQVVIAVLTGEMNLWPEGLQAVWTALGVLVARGLVSPTGKHAA